MISYKEVKRVAVSGILTGQLATVAGVGIDLARNYSNNGQTDLSTGAKVFTVIFAIAALAAANELRKSLRAARRAETH